MAILSTELTTQTYCDLRREGGVEALRTILETEQHTATTYDDAARLGESLITFFDAFCNESENGNDGTGTSSQYSPSIE